MKQYRLMKVDSDGKPVVGSNSMMLGLRPADPAEPNRRADVTARVGADRVLPGEGGLSCYSDPAKIRLQSKKLVLWSIDAADLPAKLTAQPAGVPHYHIEPRVAMTLDELQALIARTRDRWQPVEREDET